jgi:hypothetical protein
MKERNSTEEARKFLLDRVGEDGILRTIALNNPEINAYLVRLRELEGRPSLIRKTTKYDAKDYAT